MLAGPFVLFAAIGLILARDPVLEASTELHSERVLEGEQTGVSVVVRNGGARTAELRARARGMVRRSRLHRRGR